jgi:hypothetical protein
MRTIRTPTIREIFLRTLGEIGNVSASAEAAGIARTALYAWKRADPDFATEWEAALELGGDGLEDAAKKRAMEGSDVLMMFLLRGIKPGKYVQKSQVEINNTMQVADLRKLPEAELMRRLDDLRAQQDGLLALAGPND